MIKKSANFTLQKNLLGKRTHSLNLLLLWLILSIVLKSIVHAHLFAFEQLVQPALGNI